MKKRFLALLLSVLTITTITGCGSASKYEAMATNGAYAYDSASYAAPAAAYDDYSYEYEESMIAYDEESVADTSMTTSENANTSNRKLIKTVNLNVETKEYDSLVAGISSTVEEMGGYIEYMDVYNGSVYGNGKSSRYANLTVRVPAAKLGSFINAVGEKSNITYRTESVQDVTLTYVDMESHKNMLVAERDHLTELMKQAESIEDIITIEDRLTTVRYEIDSMESQLRTYDNQVDYSTVTININEVIEYTPVPTVEYTTWERISMGFVKSVKDVGVGIQEFFINLIINLPYLVIWAIIITIIVFIIKGLLRLSPKHRAKRDAKKAAKKERKAAKKAAKAAGTTDTVSNETTTTIASTNEVATEENASSKN